METKVINLYGGPGMGKSTMTAGIFYLLKSQGINAEMAREYAKDLVYSGHSQMFANQIYIFAEQLRRMKDLEGKVEFIISDSPLPLSVVYGAGESDAFRTLVWEQFETFTNLNYIVARKAPYVETGRLHTFDQSEEIASNVEQALFEHGEPYTRIDGNRRGVEQIVEQILYHRVP